MAISPNYTAVVFGELNTLYSTVEKNRTVIIPSTVRRLFESLIEESVIFRREEEWQKHTSKSDIDILDTVPISLEVVREILNGVQPETLGDTQYITLVGTLDQIASRWCRIFPFCK